jgi:BCD family chlorophyll transporter-like MFS transporter
VVGLGLILAAYAIAYVSNGPLALTFWIVAYAAIGLGIGAAGTSFLALLATAAPDARKGAAATAAWLALIIGAIAASVGTGIALDPYSDARLMAVVPVVAAIALLLAFVSTVGVERKLGAVPQPAEPNLRLALAATWNDPAARAFTGFVFLSILAFYLSELVLEPFAGHIHGLPPEDSTKLSGAKDGASLLGMIAAGVLSTFGIGSLRGWAVMGCVISAIGLIGLGLIAPLVPFTVILGLGNGLFVVGAIGSMMRLASAREGAAGTRMGVFGAAQAIAAGLAGLIATGILDIARLALPLDMAYGTVFALEAVLFLAAALVAARLLTVRAPAPTPPTGRMTMLYDVVVVGGGPSGATAAEDLARSGHKVAMIDRAGRIKPCGGAIPPRLIRDFHIPEDQLVAKIDTARMVSPTANMVDIKIENGFVGMVDREHFDEYPARPRRRMPGPSGSPAPSRASTGMRRATPPCTTATRSGEDRMTCKPAWSSAPTAPVPTSPATEVDGRRQDPLRHRLSRDHRGAGRRAEPTRPAAATWSMTATSAPISTAGSSRTANAPASAWARASRAST